MDKNQHPRRGDVPGENEAQRNAEVTRRYLEAVALSNQQRKLVMQEVLSKPSAESAPLTEQEFFELCIEESDDIWRPGFILRQTRAQWSEIDRQVMWEEPEWERLADASKGQGKLRGVEEGSRCKGIQSVGFGLLM